MRVKYPFNHTFQDYPDRYSIALIVYIMGCDTNCDGCHNPNFQNYDYKVQTIDPSPKELATLIKYTFMPYGRPKLVLSGGDPLAPRNVLDTWFLLRHLSEQEIDVCVYTSLSIQEVKETTVGPFKYIKCGKFKKELSKYPNKTELSMTFASSNQELYNSKCEKISENGIYFFEEEIN